MRLRLAVLALGLCAGQALGQQGGRAPARTGPDRAAHDKGAPVRSGAPQVIGCPSLANYRMLMRGGAPAAAALLADPKADHLGCSTLSRGEITGIADRVSLGGESYDCAGVRGTTTCHWMEAGATGRPAPAAR
ncbi:hypothetical protein [Methylobacterium sp. NEAU K]|uniref:hypothetical protein n=1 Tax=Methylobacterium sp. NEAU K TaxID=3064946 RepID=UPI0027334054|nr:hypothetical protein [Methylobacterium sp. NEAU K]MDP4005402.1 hypothetical protein [Methylobacterium sp. NEAU K]